MQLYVERKSVSYMTQNKTLAIAGIGVAIVLLLVCAGTALIVSSVTANQNAATATVETVVEVLPVDPIAPAATEVAGGVLPPPGMVEVATNTPPPTNTPEPTAVPTDTPAPTEVPPTATNTAVPVQPTSLPPPPPPAPTSPPPTDVPPPPPPAQDTRGLSSTFFQLHDGQSPNVGSGNPIWFHFIVANSGGIPVPFGGLGVLPRKDGADRFDLFQASWGNDAVQPSGLDWIDHIDISEGGNYTLRLAVCFDVSVDQCRQGAGNWATLSAEIPVTVR